MSSSEDNLRGSNVSLIVAKRRDAGTLPRLKIKQIHERYTHLDLDSKRRALAKLRPLGAAVP